MVTIMQDRGGPKQGDPSDPLIQPTFSPYLSLRNFPRCESSFLGTTAVRPASSSLGALVHSSTGSCLKRGWSLLYCCPE